MKMQNNTTCACRPKVRVRGGVTNRKVSRELSEDAEQGHSRQVSREDAEQHYLCNKLPPRRPGLVSGHRGARDAAILQEDASECTDTHTEQERKWKTAKPPLMDSLFCQSLRVDDSHLPAKMKGVT